MIYNLMRYKKIITLVLMILLVICGIIYKNTVYDKEVIVIEEDVEQKEDKETPMEQLVEETTITVYVCGSVMTPINVTLPRDSRVEDAIKLAGGVTETADLNSINMAQRLNDEDMVYVPKKGEIIESTSKNSTMSPSPAKKGKININKATIEELDTLPGIGPATAQKIIEYRKSSGGFKSIDELNNVSGIGNEKYKDIKNFIVVE